MLTRAHSDATVNAGVGRATAIFTAWGHPAVRATHPSSWELTLEHAISRRATCVVGVRTAVERDQLRRWEGELAITLRAGAYRAVVRATAHPGFRLERRIVVRRSWYRDADTFAVGADVGAAGLPRELVAELSHPDTRLVVTVEGRRAGGGLLRVGSAAPDPSALTIGEPAAPRMPTPEEAIMALRDGGTVVCCTEDVASGALARRLAAAAVEVGAEVEPVGLAPEMAVLLLAGFEPEAPVCIARVDRLRPYQVPASAICVCSVLAARLPHFLAEVERVRGDGPTLVALDATRPAETALRGTVGKLRGQLSAARGRSLVVLAPTRAGEAGLLSRLALEGVPALTLTRAATALGWSRRDLYRVVGEVAQPKQSR
jgi:hypothetical protein